MNVAAQKTSRQRRSQSFGDELKRAVTDRVPSRSGHAVTAETDHGETFSEQVKEAVVQQLGGLPAEKRQADRERERARYRRSRR